MTLLADGDTPEGKKSESPQMKPKNQGSDKEIGVLDQPTPHILVVDDDEVIRLQLARL